MDIKTEHYASEAVKELNNPSSRMFLDFFLPVLSAVREIGMGSFPDPCAAIDRAREIRKRSVANLKPLLEKFEKNAVSAGAKVFWARDAEEANSYIKELIEKRGISYVTKGKSMITEELGLNDFLEKNGINVFETDLGEFIIQLLKKPPFHIIGPAINIPVDQISSIFMEKAGMKTPSTDPQVLGQAAREFLRDKFRHMSLGITGVNMAVAETGSIINVENEGNIRFNKSAPDIQVSVMSIEKVVDSLDEAMHMTRILCRHGTGQKITSYVTIDTGPSKKDEIDGPKELHIVILDNGRTKIYRNPETREVLQCIRCGACINVCPVFRKTGGYPYGWAYTGPIGKLLNPMLLGLDRTADIYGACTLCRKCREVCPAGIDHPSKIIYLRNRNMKKDSGLHGKGASFSNRLFAKASSFSSSYPFFWDTVAARIAGLAQHLPDSRLIKAWTLKRNMPPVPDRTYRKIRKNKVTK